jgi:hypothetical protein
LGKRIACRLIYLQRMGQNFIHNKDFVAVVVARYMQLDLQFERTEIKVLSAPREADSYQNGNQSLISPSFPDF